MSSTKSPAEAEWLDLAEFADVTFYRDLPSDEPKRKPRWKLSPTIEKRHPSDLTFRIVIPPDSKE